MRLSFALTICESWAIFVVSSWCVPLIRLFLKNDTLYHVGHPISSNNSLISQKLLLKSESYYPLHVAMGIAYSCLKYRVLSQLDLMLYKFKTITVRAHGRIKSLYLILFLGVELDKDAVCFFGKLY